MDDETLEPTRRAASEEPLRQSEVEERGRTRVQPSRVQAEGKGHVLGRRFEIGRQGLSADERTATDERDDVDVSRRASSRSEQKQSRAADHKPPRGGARVPRARRRAWPGLLQAISAKGSTV